MKENNKIKADEWYEKAQHDLATVEMIINATGYADTAAVLLQQAVEKYLKGYLIEKGWKLVKTHNLRYLLDEVVKSNNKFERFYDLIERLTVYYIELKYPYSKVVISLEEIKSNYEKVKELVDLIKNE